MSSRESTTMVYNMILRNFKHCSNKQHFQLIDFICNPIFSMKTAEEIREIYSQSCEQLFSVLRRISTQIAYMRFDKLFFNIRYFLACWNINKSK